MKRRQAIVAAPLLLSTGLANAAAPATPVAPNGRGKTLRYAFVIDGTSGQRFSDVMRRA